MILVTTLSSVANKQINSKQKNKSIVWVSSANQLCDWESLLQHLLVEKIVNIAQEKQPIMCPTPSYVRCSQYKVEKKKTKTQKILSSSGFSLTSWLTPGQVYETSRENPEIGSVMG